MSPWRNLSLALSFILAALILAAPAVAQDDDATSVSEEALAAALEKAGDNLAELQKAIDTAPEAQQAAVRFLIAYMPETDLQSLSAEFILKNVGFAYTAREAVPWGKDIPDEVFFNDVLPYASINERRDDWRKDFFERFLPLVKDCQTPAEAAQALNRQMFPIVNVQYHATKRPKPNQSPYESMEATYASCSGLSVLLIDACRAVCVPTRFAGTASWTTKRGNHSWVEIWSDGDWHFTGACEADPNGLDRGWFVGDAAQADKDNRSNAIWATSWKTTGDSFPMVWARRDTSVPAVNVTDHYTKKKSETEIPEGKVLVSFEVFDQSGERIRCMITIQVDEIDFAGLTTGSGDDTNNRFELPLEPETEYAVGIYVDRVKVQREEFITTTEKWQNLRFVLKPKEAGDKVVAASDALAALRKYLARPYDDRPALQDQGFANEALSAADAKEAGKLLWEDHAEHIRQTRAGEMEAKEFAYGDKTLKFDYITYGEKPEGGRSLFISLHGGGGAPARVNDSQWENQKRLYKPEEGIYLAPRAPTDTWNLWHQAHIDPMFDHLIENMVVFEDVNPNRVYVMGYSAGGDGVYQIGPRMADRWAAAAMMAGHPNEAQPLSLRNIGFALHMGANDGAYNRNAVAKAWGEKLAKLHEEDPDGYINHVQLHEGKGHWMDREDAVAVPWMAEFTRNPRPQKIVWLQDDVTHDRFYWLAVDGEHKRGRTLIRAEVDGQTVKLQSDDVSAMTVLLDDALVDLGQPVTVTFNDKPVFQGSIDRTIAALAKSLSERGDGRAMFSARVRVSLD